jgi:hypothetical protein
MLDLQREEIFPIITHKKAKIEAKFGGNTLLNPAKGAITNFFNSQKL